MFLPQWLGYIYCRKWQYCFVLYIVIVYRDVDILYSFTLIDLWNIPWDWWLCQKAIIVDYELKFRNRNAWYLTEPWTMRGNAFSTRQLAIFKAIVGWFESLKQRISEALLPSWDQIWPQHLSQTILLTLVSQSTGTQADYMLKFRV